MAKNELIFVMHRAPIRLHDRDATDDVINFISRRLNARFAAAAIIIWSDWQSEAGHNGRVIVEVSTLSPLLDLDLLENAVKIAEVEKCEVEIDGAVPGTTPIRVYHSNKQASEKARFLLWGTQRRYNAQLNLKKLKRIKMFFYFMQKLENLALIPIEEFLDYLGSDDGVRDVLSYGTKLKLKHLDSCPICGCARVYKLHHDAGQPVIGYLTKDSKYYDLCGNCGLVFLNPTIAQADLGNLYEWYDSEGKAEATAELYSRAALMRHASYANFRLFLDKYAPRMPTKARLMDLGGGHGEFAVTAKADFPH